MQKLFEEFDPTTEESWIERIKKDLKGKELSILDHQVDPDISVPSYHYKYSALSEGERRHAQGAGKSWVVLEEFTSLHSNKEVLDALNRGTNGLWFEDVKSGEFKQLTENVLFNHINSYLVQKSSDAVIDGLDENIKVLCDPITEMLQNGEERDLSNYMESAIVFVDSTIYAASGATLSQEVGYTLAHLNEYLHLSKESGNFPKEGIVIRLAASNDYLANIAKLRAVRELVASLTGAYETILNLEIIATTNNLYYTQNDRNTNLLRMTAQTMSNAIGGADALSVKPIRNSDEFDRRIARNIQLVLQEEAYFGLVGDPSGGAYAIEHLTDQIISVGWEKFKELENTGGLLNAVRSNKIQEDIESSRKSLIEQYANQKKTLIGVNKYLNSLEDFVDVKTDEQRSSKDFKCLSPFHLEAFVTTQKIEE